MNPRIFYKWIDKCSGITDQNDVGLCKRVFENVPGIDAVLNTAMGLGLDKNSIRPLIEEARSKATRPVIPEAPVSVPAMVGAQNKPSNSTGKMTMVSPKQPFFKKIFAKKKKHKGR